MQCTRENLVRIFNVNPHSAQGRMDGEHKEKATTVRFQWVQCAYPQTTHRRRVQHRKWLAVNDARPRDGRAKCRRDAGHFRGLRRHVVPHSPSSLRVASVKLTHSPNAADLIRSWVIVGRSFKHSSFSFWASAAKTITSVLTRSMSSFVAIIVIVWAPACDMTKKVICDGVGCDRLCSCYTI